jgi:hypothetical protein
MHVDPVVPAVEGQYCICSPTATMLYDSRGVQQELTMQPLAQHLSHYAADHLRVKTILKHGCGSLFIVATDYWSVFCGGRSAVVMWL